jgi:hypothetical protein
MCSNYFEAASEAAAAFFDALCVAFFDDFIFLTTGAEAGAEAASAAKAPTAKVETIRAARSLVILKYLKWLKLLARQGVAAFKRIALSSG